MAATIIVFLKWFFGLKTVDVEDITVRMNEQGLGDTSVAEVQEALALLADEVDSEQQQLISQTAAHLQAVASGLATDGSGAFGSFTASDIAASLALPDPLDVIPGIPGISVTTSSSESASGVADPVIDTTPPAPASTTDSAAPAPAPMDTSPAPPSGPGQAPPPPPVYEPPGHDQPPPPFYEAPGHDQPPPPVNEAPGNGEPPPVNEAPIDYPDTWAGFYPVTITEDGAYIDFEGVVSRLEPDGQGGFVVNYLGYAIGPPLDQLANVAYNLPPSFSWVDPATGEQYLVVGLHDDGISLYHSRGESPNGYYTIRLTPDGVILVDPDGNPYADSYADVQSLLAEVPLDIRFRAEPPPTWAGYEVHTEGIGPYVLIDDLRVYIVLADDETFDGFHPNRPEFRFEPGPDGLIWTNSPSGEPYPVVELTDGGLVIAHPQGLGEGRIEIGYDRVVLYVDGGGALTYPTPPYEFYGLSDTPLGFAPFSVEFVHADGYHVLQWNGHERYLDPETGDIYETLDELLAAEGDSGIEYPDFWGGAIVGHDDDGAYVIIDGVDVRLVPGEDGDLEGVHLEYRIREQADGSLAWVNTPTGEAYQVDRFGHDDLRIISGGDAVLFTENGFIYTTPAGSTQIDTGGDTGVAFYELTDGYIEVTTPEAYRVRITDELAYLIVDPDTGLTYATVEEWQSALDGTEPLGTWGGHDVHVDDGSRFIEVAGTRVDLEPDGEGGFYADHQGYRLEERPDGTIVWSNSPTGETYAVDNITTDGIDISRGGEIVRLTPEGITYFSEIAPNQDTYFSSDEFTFVELTHDYITLVNVADGRELRVTETGETFYVEAPGDDPPGGEGGGSLGDPVDYPSSWGGHAILVDGDGPYVEVDGVRLDLEASPDGYYADHLDYRLVHPPDTIDALAWANTPDGTAHIISAVFADGIQVQHPVIGHVTFREDSFSYEYPGGGGTSTVSFGEPWEFRGFSPEGIIANHPDGYSIIYGPEYLVYLDPATGETYDSYTDLQEALAAEPPIDDAPGTADEPGSGDGQEPYPEAWGGVDVQTDGDGPYVEVDGVRLDLEASPDGYYADHLDYRLVQQPDGTLAWTNTPDGTAHTISAVFADGIEVPHPVTGYVTFRADEFEYNWTTSGGGLSTIKFGEPWEFESFAPSGLIANHPDGYSIIYGETPVYLDPATGETYESFGEWQADQTGGAAPDDTVQQITSGEWGGQQVMDGIDGYYIEIGEGTYYLQYDDEGAYIGVGGYAAREIGDRLLIEVNGEGYELDTTHPDGPSFAIPTSDGPVQFVFVTGTGYTFYANAPVSIDGGWYAVRDGELIDVPDDQLYAYAQDPTIIEVDTVDGERGGDPPVEADAGLSAGELSGDDSGGGDQFGADVPNEGVLVGGETGGNGNGTGNGNGNGNGAPPAESEDDGVDTLFSVNNQPDSVSITHNGQPLLRIVEDGATYELPLNLRDGGYFVTIGGQEYEVHTQGTTYFVVADGQAYDLGGSPSAPGWPFDHPASGVDGSAYVEAPPPPAPVPVSEPDPAAGGELPADGAPAAGDVGNDAEGDLEGEDVTDFFDLPPVDLEPQSDGSPAPAEPPAPIEDTLPPADAPPEESAAPIEMPDDETLETG